MSWKVEQAINVMHISGFPGSIKLGVPQANSSRDTMSAISQQILNGASDGRACQVCSIFHPSFDSNLNLPDLSTPLVRFLEKLCEVEYP